MNDVQRYTTREIAQWTKSDPDAEWVAAPRHVAALAQAEQRIIDQAAEVVEGISWNKGYEQGQRDALAGAEQRVEALAHDGRGMSGHDLSEVIAAIKGDSDGT